MLYWVISYINIILNGKKNHNTLTVPFEKSQTVSFANSIMKNIVEPSALSRFPVKLICCIAFGPASSFYCLLKSVAINLL